MRYGFWLTVLKDYPGGPESGHTGCMRAPGDTARVPVPAPMLATPGPVPNGPQWTIEPKWDGARLVTRVENGRADLFSRHANNLTSSFPEVRAACLEAVGSRRVVLDGEIVVLDRAARPSFQLLQRRLHVSHPRATLLNGCSATLFVFDVLHLDGQDLTTLPYLQRRAVLDELGLDDAGHRLVRSPAWPGLDGAAALEIMDSLRLEGVVAKAAHSPYQAGRRSRHWIKDAHPA